ncbi:MAG: polysaccharide export protein [Bryobacterales bacterium]|jgi:polysaccharide export outer membrane protein|nr:polysaccharide export protein [Bryobacterales bacterium]
MRTTTLFLPIAASLVCASLGVAQMASFSEREPRYHLQPLDVMEVHYRFSPEFDQIVTIQPDGFVALLLVGDTRVQGLTLDQARHAIWEKAAQRLRDPEITLTLKEFEKPYFTVGGEVTTPGRFPMLGPVSPLQAIAMAGGFKTASARNSQVILFRRVGPDLAETQILDLRVDSGRASKELGSDLRTGDMLIVPQNQISKIERFIKLANIGAYVPLK